MMSRINKQFKGLFFEGGPFEATQNILDWIVFHRNWIGTKIP
jgi:hypothetical protein